MNKKELEIADIKGKINFLKKDINDHWYSYLIVTQDYKEIKELEKKLKELDNEQKKIDEKQKRLYKGAKFYSIIYNMPLYITWKYRYFPQDLRYIKKYGYKN